MSQATLNGDVVSHTEAEKAADLFQAHREELGFVNRAQCREGDLVTVERDGDVVGALLGNHCVRKPQSTVYELAVSEAFRRQGIASELVERFAAESPHDKLVAKCPEELPSNEFYKSDGWELVDRDEGKSRALNVWERATDYTPDVITTGRPDLTEIAGEYGWLRGSRVDYVSRYESRGVSLDFLDLHWEDPDQDGLLAAAERHEPKYAVAGDYDGENYAEINAFADELSEFVENVIIVPHDPGEVSMVPEWAVVGYSTPTGYAGTDAPVWEYYGRDVHILGGKIEQIVELWGYLRDEIVSIDFNSFHRGATSFAKWWGATTPSWNVLDEPVPKPSNAEKAYANSLLNMNYALREQGIVE